MQNRSLGVTTLAFTSVMIALYCQFAAIALILTGSIYTAAGSSPGAFTLLTGAVFLGLTFGAYFIGFGLWTRKHWAWAGSVALLVVLVGASAALSVISTNFVSLIVPTVAAVAGIWYLHRPAVKAELLGSHESDLSPVRVADGMDAPEPAH